MGHQAEPAEQDADAAPEQEHKSLWHRLEDATGGRAQVLKAGDQQQSNFEHIEGHQDAEDH